VQEIVRGCNGRAIPAQNLHITLAFLGSVPEKNIGHVAAVAMEVAGELKGERVRISLDAAEHWKKAHLVCATARAPAVPSADHGSDGGSGDHARADRGDYRDRTEYKLAATLKSRLTAAGFAPDLKPFRPHVTLARGAHHPPRLTKMEPVIWCFTDFVLADSKTHPDGSVYTILRRFAFAQ